MKPQAYLATRFGYYAKRLHMFNLDDETWSVDAPRVVDPSVLAAWSTMPELFPRCHALRVHSSYLRLFIRRDEFLAAWMYQPRIDELRIITEPHHIALYERRHGAMAHKWGELKILRLYRNDELGTPRAHWLAPDMRRRWAMLNSTLLARATSLCDIRITVPIGWEGVVVASTLPALIALDLSMVVELPHGVCRFPDGAFRRLSALYLEDSTPDARLALGILEVCTATLTDCRLELCEVVKPQHIREVMRSVSQHGKLRKAIVEFAYEEHDWAPIFDAMVPMAHMTNLTTRIEIEVTETHLTQILRLCPHLQQWDGPMTPCVLSLPAIMAILAPRPSLRCIPLAVDVSQGLPSAAQIASFGTRAFVGSLRLQNFDAESKKCAEEILKRLFRKVGLASYVATKHTYCATDTKALTMPAEMLRALI
jgi:hypothetical protein